MLGIGSSMWNIGTSVIGTARSLLPSTLTLPSSNTLLKPVSEFVQSAKNIGFLLGNTVGCIGPKILIDNLRKKVPVLVNVGMFDGLALGLHEFLSPKSIVTKIIEVVSYHGEGGGNMLQTMESFLSKDELNRLNKKELAVLQRNIELGEEINRRFCRSQYYPFPRDLCFPPEKPLLSKWANGRQKLVEIGIFEGASSAMFRASMSPDGVLHLIDPFVKVPDSKLTARQLMARINLLRSTRGKVKWYRDYSYNVVQNWKEEIDLLFIDGDHSEIAVRNDWLSWHKFVKVGGVVLFHDARFGRGDGSYWDGWPGPGKIVEELFRGPNKLPNWKIVDEAGSLVVVERSY